MRKSRILTLFLMACLCASSAWAEGPFTKGGRALKERLNPPIGGGTLIAMAPESTDAGMPFLVLDTALGKGVTCYTLSQDQLQKLSRRKVEIGAIINVLATHSNVASVGEMDCWGVSSLTFRPRPKGKKSSETDFLIKFRGPILSLALRGRPGTIEAFGLRGLLMEQADSIGQVIATFQSLGIPLGKVEEVKAEEPPKPSDQACRLVLHSLKPVLEELRLMGEEASRKGRDHHGDIDGEASTALSLIASFFDGSLALPPVQPTGSQ